MSNARERVRAPVFILPTMLSDMSDDDLDKFLEQVRERRLRVVREHQEAERLKAEAHTEKLQAKVEKQFEMLGKEMASLDKVIAKLDKRITNIQALRIELGVQLNLL